MYKMKFPLVLASQSQSRYDLLSNCGLSCERYPSHFEEIPLSHETPLEYVARNAYEKGRSVAQQLANRDKTVVLSADTLAFDEKYQIFEKPSDFEDCRRMMRAFSGKPHTVSTAFSVFWTGETPQLIHQETVITQVKFRNLTDSELSMYPFYYPNCQNVAGGYSLQMNSIAIAFLEDIQGDFYSVIGLPIGKIFSSFLKHDLCYIETSF